MPKSFYSPLAVFMQYSISGPYMVLLGFLTTYIIVYLTRACLRIIIKISSNPVPKCKVILFFYTLIIFQVKHYLPPPSELAINKSFNLSPQIFFKTAVPKYFPSITQQCSDEPVPHQFYNTPTVDKQEETMVRRAVQLPSSSSYVVI